MPPRLPLPVLPALLVLACGGSPSGGETTGTGTGTAATGSGETGETSASTRGEPTSSSGNTTTTGPASTAGATGPETMTDPTGAVGPSCDGEAIDAPAATWTWVDVPGTLCGYGTPTGLGINPAPRSDKLLIYLLGGGGCFNAQECGPGCDPMSQHCAANLDGFDAARLQQSLQLYFKAGSIFDRESPDNPFRDHHWVFVPYCTGDFHAGSKQSDYGVHHVGFTNMTLYLERVVPTFCDVSEVVLTGSSAGGFGAVFNYEQVAAAFAPLRVDLVDDSGPPLGPDLMPLQGTMRAAWGAAATAPPGCPECAQSWEAFFPYYSSTWPEANLALISSLADYSIGPYFGGPIAQPDGFRAALEAFADDVLGPLPRARVFYVDEFFHVYLAETLAAKVSQGMSLATWLNQLVIHDPAWSDVRP